MDEYTEDMEQAATYWPPAGNDGTGRQMFGAPVALDPGVRWQEKAEMFRDSQGREVVSSAVVYVPEPLEIGGYLFLGTSAEADPRNEEGSREIRQVGFSTDLDADVRLNKVWL